MNSIEEIKKEIKQRMEVAFLHIQDKIKKIRTGSADSSLLEGLKVHSYGSEQQLKHIATISCPDARSIVISPWDQNTLKDIEQALIKSDAGMAPLRDGKVIRLRVPELTQERREEILKAFKKEVEKARVELRQIRKIMNEKVRKILKEKSISEDMAKETESAIQKMTDEFTNKVHDISEKKEKELIQV